MTLRTIPRALDRTRGACASGVRRVLQAEGICVAHHRDCLFYEYDQKFMSWCCNHLSVFASSLNLQRRPKCSASWLPRAPVSRNSSKSHLLRLTLPDSKRQKTILVNATVDPLLRKRQHFIKILRITILAMIEEESDDGPMVVVENKLRAPGQIRSLVLRTGAIRRVPEF
jgi:hypothetical protein